MELESLKKLVSVEDCLLADTCRLGEDFSAVPGNVSMVTDVWGCPTMAFQSGAREKCY